MGGMQKHSYCMAKYFAQREIFVDVYHAIPFGKEPPADYSEFGDEELKYLNFIPVHFPRNHRFPGHYVWESYLYSKRLCRQFMQQLSKADFVYIQGFSGWYFLKNNRNKIPNGINFHGVEMFQPAPDFKEKLRHLVLKPFVKTNLKRADVIFSLGGKLSQIQAKIVPDAEIVEIPIGITAGWTAQSVGCAGNRIRFVFVGRYERRKGIEELNIALENLLKANAPFEFHFIGPIPAGKRIEAPEMVYHGAVYGEQKIKQILVEADVLVCPSWSEGMPTVILEAMASGCAVIASDVGAVSMQVDEKNGVLIEAGNVNALTDALNRMINIYRNILQKMKINSVKRVQQKFLWDRVIEQTVEFLEKSIGTE
jgi:glycosyltransferase involved in cell wall biosynthesis